MPRYTDGAPKNGAGIVTLGNSIADAARGRGLVGPRERGSRQEYVHIKPRVVHLLQTGRSPEHFGNT